MNECIEEIEKRKEMLVRNRRKTKPIAQKINRQKIIENLLALELWTISIAAQAEM